jgi:hypothetical protein
MREYSACSLSHWVVTSSLVPSVVAMIESLVVATFSTTIVLSAAGWLAEPAWRACDGSMSWRVSRYSSVSLSAWWPHSWMMIR